MENTVFIIHQLYLFCHSTAGSELRAQGLPDPARSPPRPAGEQSGRAAPHSPPPYPTPDFRFKEGGAVAERSTQAGEEVGDCRSIPGCPERGLERITTLAPSLCSPAPASLPFWGTRGAQQPGRGSRGVGSGGVGGGAERQADTLEVAQAGPPVQPPLTERSLGPDRRPGAGPGGA